MDSPRLKRLAVALTGVTLALFFAGLVLMPNGAITAMVWIAAIVNAAAFAALLLIRRGRRDRAVVLLVVSIVACATGALWTPLAAVYDTVALGPFLAAMGAILYLRGRAVRPILAVCLVDALGILVYGILDPHLPPLLPATRWFLVVAFLAATGGVFWMGLDVVTKRRIAQAYGDQANESFWALVNLVPDAVFGHRDSKVVFANPATVALFGIPLEKLLGLSIFDLVHADEAEDIRRRSEILATGRANPMREMRIADRDGRARWVESISVPMELPGEGAMAVVFCRDITEKKLLEAEFRQAQKMEAVGRLAGGVAHDFNNLLSVILSYTRLAVDDLPPGSPLREDLTEVKEAGERAAALTRQLLAFSRRQPSEPKVVELAPILSGQQKMLGRLLGDDVTLTIECPAKRLVKVDAGAIDQLVMNLAVNARDAMPHGGTIAIKAEDVDLDGGFAGGSHDVKPGPHVRLSVADTGTGMSGEVLQHIFEPFFTTKGPGKGTGLGLAIVYGIVQQSGGSLRVRSEVGQGTTFEIDLPEAREEAEEAAAPAAAPLPRGSETLLVAEDDAGLLKLLAKVLSGQGYQVITARDGAEALVRARERRDPIQLVLTDVVMPGLSGPDLVARLREDRAGIKVVYLSGYPREEDEAGAPPAGRVARMEKPIEPAALARKVREILDAG